MFTGLIQSVGTVNRRDESLIVKGYESFAPLSLGDSVAVDGVCLTVSDFFGGGFLADISEETLERTTLNIKSRKGSFVNLEPALRLSDRLGGHLVSGHIDCIGKVASIKNLDNSWQLEIDLLKNDSAKYICEKGSICVDGISLTIAGFSQDDNQFWIAVVPHTWKSTSLQYFKEGDLVNLEMDLMAKYAERILAGSIKNQVIGNDAISKEWLAQNGWI